MGSEPKWEWRAGDDKRREADAWDQVAVTAFKESDFGHYDAAKAKALRLRREARELDHGV